MAYTAAAMLDRAHTGDAGARDRVDLMTPIVKSWCTEAAQIVTNLGVQVFGGMGFVEETGAAQFVRDARILPIYEGTNGIQAADLVFRKVQKNSGAFIDTWMAEVRESGAGSIVLSALDLVHTATQRITAMEADSASAVSHAYLMLCGTVMAGVMMDKTLRDNTATLRQKTIAQFYLDQILPEAAMYAARVAGRVDSVLSDPLTLWP
jgi:hypothetical protein